MMPLLAHVTTAEYPLGLALFLGGIGVGLGVGIGIGILKYFRPR
ncbi:hypothetical protein PLANPX_5597 [Lacipirellula parvula]|jgi:hypothetical protein|uniref:Uncharacterized protein n=1 Tax=Lacipirellula parvula TaxID=2650471 RepID=A0A5K7XHV3_9BACT|nr:hypothetical protein PLANPX_5597 [Lacipirellula parvula]